VLDLTVLGSSQALLEVMSPVVTISTDDEGPYEDDSLNTGTHPDLPGVPIVETTTKTVYSCATGLGLRTIFHDPPPVASPTLAVAAGGSTVAPTGFVRIRVVELESAAVTLANMAGQPPPPPPPSFVRRRPRPNRWSSRSCTQFARAESGGFKK
jgi:hypothetical protein